MLNKTFILLLALVAIVNGAFAKEKIVVAVNPLSAEGALAEQEEIISNVMQAELSVSENLTLVERKNLLNALKELQLSSQGMVAPESVSKLGKIVGAKYFCSGKISKSGDKTIAVVKVVNVETTVTKLAYATLKSKDDAIEAGKSLAKSIETLIANFNAENKELAKNANKTAVKEIPKDWKRPVVMVIIPEMNVTQHNLIDPAAENELVKRLIKDGFTVKNAEYVTMMRKELAKNPGALKKTSVELAADKGVDVLIYGEAISELGARLGSFEGCRARVEVKAVNTKDGSIILSESSYGGATDLAESTAGKMALQNAANKLADKIDYKLAEAFNK